RADRRGSRDEEGAGPLEGGAHLECNFLGVCPVPIPRHGGRHPIVVRAALVGFVRFGPFLMCLGPPGAPKRTCRFQSHAGEGTNCVPALAFTGQRRVPDALAGRSHRRSKSFAITIAAICPWFRNDRITDVSSAVQPKSSLTSPSRLPRSNVQTTPVIVPGVN